MQEVWFVFRLLEMTLGLFCSAYHIKGFLSVQLDEHYEFTCLIFILNISHMFGCINVCAGTPNTPMWETINNFLNALLYLIISLWTMYHAEKDFYLVYLSEFEQPVHPFFAYSKSQGISALACSLMHTLHCLFAFGIWNKKRKADSETETQDVDTQMYLCGKKVQEKLEKYRWFKQFADKINRPPTH